MPAFSLLRLTAALLILASQASIAQAQTYNPKKGYIFEQAYVTRIAEDQANKLLQMEKAADFLLRKHDQHPQRIAYPSSVQRKGKVLVFYAPNRSPLKLVDWRKAETKNAEGDEQKFVFLETIGNYYVVCVEFQHDAPGFLLIEKDSLKVDFFHQ